VATLLRTSPSLARERLTVGATRAVSEKFFFPEIHHYLIAGDTVLTQLWCNANALQNSSGEQTSPRQFNAGATVHLALERFQPVDVTFHRTNAE
jgi:hypothetical protein